MALTNSFLGRRPVRALLCVVLIRHSLESLTFSWLRTKAVPSETTNSHCKSTGGTLAGVDTIIFDIDDTLYPVSSGLSKHRMGNVTLRFMQEKLGFETADDAMNVWLEYIQRYHSTLKGLNVAMKEGRLPQPFKQEELGQFWAEHCEFSKFLQKDPKLTGMLQSLQDTGMKLVAFTNAPRRYALRCLECLGLKHLFPDDHIFAVEDVLPACKPEKEAFETVLRQTGAQADRTVMFEDSMKNIRAAKKLGLHTVLVHESNRAGSEALIVGDDPDPTDPAADCVIANVAEARNVLPGLWNHSFPR